MVAREFTLDFQVRDSELDQFGVVNNAVYQVYLEHARHEFLIFTGLDAAAVAAQGRSLALAGINIRYLAPLRSRDRFRICLTLSRLSGVRAVFHQKILKLPHDAPILEAWAEAIFLNEQARPMRLPAAFKAGVESYLEAPEG